jgi:hypothetical protein
MVRGGSRDRRSGVDLKSLSLGERIAAASGAALFVFMFVSWLEGRTAWELFSLLDVLLAIVALIAVALPLIKATAPDSPLRVSIGSVLSRAGLVALTITATFLIEGADRNVGIFLAVLASAGILYGGMTTPEDGAPRSGGRRRGERSRRAYSSDDFEEPPPGMEEWRGGGRSWADEGLEEGLGRAPSGLEDDAPARRRAPFDLNEAELDDEDPDRSLREPTARERTTRRTRPAGDDPTEDQPPRAP